MTVNKMMIVHWQFWNEMSSIQTIKALSVQLIKEDQFAKPSCLKRSGLKNEVFHQMISWIIWDGSRGGWSLQFKALKCLRGLKADGYCTVTNLAGFVSITPSSVSPWPQSKESLDKYTWLP